MSFPKMFRRVIKSREKEAPPPEPRVPKVVALFPIYNSATTLSLTLDSLLPYVDRLIMFEGAHEESLQDGVRSLDRTLNIAYAYQKDHPSKVELYLQRSRMTRQEKWNYLINLVMPGDLALLMDFDEALLVSVEDPFWQVRQDAADYYLLDVVNYVADGHQVDVVPQLKLIRKKAGLRFTGKNWVVMGEKEEILGGEGVTVELLKKMGWYLPKVQIFRLDFLRPILLRSSTPRP